MVYSRREGDSPGSFTHGVFMYDPADPALTSSGTFTLDDGEDWGDDLHDRWLYAACESVLSCYRDGDRAATVEAVEEFFANSSYCENDQCIIFEFLFDVAKGNVECEEEFKNRVITFRSLYNC
jgi:hypothetical protein